MDKIEWGEPIRVDGKRPEWLRDDDICAVIDPDASKRYYLGEDGSMTADDWTWHPVTYFKLSADHPHYAKAVPQWAFGRAVEEVGGDEKFPAVYLRPFARYIAEHEEAPKDEATLLAEELYQAAYPNGDGLPENGIRDAWMRVAHHLIHKGKESRE